MIKEEKLFVFINFPSIIKKFQSKKVLILQKYPNYVYIAKITMIIYKLVYYKNHLKKEYRNRIYK